MNSHVFTYRVSRCREVLIAIQKVGIKDVIQAVESAVTLDNVLDMPALSVADIYAFSFACKTGILKGAHFKPPKSNNLTKALILYQARHDAMLADRIRRQDIDFENELSDAWERLFERGSVAEAREKFRIFLSGVGEAMKQVVNRAYLSALKNSKL